MTNRDKKDSIRSRMAYAGEPFNVARRKVEAAAAGRISKAELPEIEPCVPRNSEVLEARAG